MRRWDHCIHPECTELDLAQAGMEGLEYISHRNSSHKMCRLTPGRQGTIRYKHQVIHQDSPKLALEQATGLEMGMVWGLVLEVVAPGSELEARTCPNTNSGSQPDHLLVAANHRKAGRCPWHGN